MHGFHKMIICLDRKNATEASLAVNVKFIFIKHAFWEILTALVCYQLFQLY